MATTATKTDPNSQSVYIADQDTVKVYPKSATNSEINYDIHTNVRGKSPEDYFVNFLPLVATQSAWKYVTQNGDAIFKAVEETPPGQIAKATGAALKYENDVMQPALKFLVSDPEAAIGLRKETSPEAIQNTYKPWLDIWRESEVGSKLTGASDKALANAPLPIAAIPWFVTEFAPTQLLEFGTKASNWLGAYGVEKFGPPIINSIISKLPEPARKVLLTDIFKAETSLASDFETLGINPNAKTSEVVDAYRSAAKVAHPDVGGSAEEFQMISQAYKNIMQSRSTWTDKLFDMFRDSSSFKNRTSTGEGKILSLLSNSRGSAMIPFSEGELVKVGEQLGRFVKLTGNIALVNVAGKLSEIPLHDITPIPRGISNDTAINLENLQTADLAHENLIKATQEIKNSLENQKMKPITHEEIIQASKGAELLTQGVSRETTLKFEASLLKTREHLAALAQQDELTPEFLDALRIVANTGTDVARTLESFKLSAFPEFADVKVKIVKDLIKLGLESDKILEASKGVDFKDEQSVAKFYRKFVKPTIPEMLDEFVYMNILSSPLTHIVNATSNAIQLLGLNPLTRLASGAIDNVVTSLTGKERAHYVSEIPAFYKGVLNSVPRAFDYALQAMKGKKNLDRPDIKHLPTLSKLVDWGTLKVGKYVTRALEASDIFFRTMIESGEVEALSKKLGHAPDEKELEKIRKEAKENADYYVFRKKPDANNESGQGELLSALDQMTNAVYRFRSVPGMKWFIRFVQTPMNMLKQGLEYSPIGASTLKGAKDKTEQTAKVIVGSIVFSIASWLSAMGRTTWSAPTSERDKNDFYASGLQPYSIRIGDHWVSYSKLGPLSYPIAMAAALNWFTKESPKALSDSEMDKVSDALSGLMKFVSDQSYMQGLGDLVAFSQGEKSKSVAGVPTQLIPLSSLQGWVNNIIDPLQRKAEKGLSINSVVDQLQMKIIGMSKYVPAQIDVEEVPVKKQMRLANAISPFKVSKVDKGNLADYKENIKIQQEINLAKKEASS